MELLFNIQVMCFIERNKIDSYFSELKKHYNNNKYKKFLINNDEDIKHFQFTNNISENINKYINSNLKRARCSNTLFREAFLNLISQFKNKGENKTIDKKNLIF